MNNLLEGINSFILHILLLLPDTLAEVCGKEVWELQVFISLFHFPCMSLSKIEKYVLKSLTHFVLSHFRKEKGQ
jgi:hypothetical protein